MVSNNRFWIISSAIVLLLWGIGGWVLVPSVIRDAYAGESFGFLNRIISGQDENPVDTYLNAWARIRLLLTVLLVLGIVGVRYAARNWAGIRQGVSDSYQTLRSGRQATVLEILAIGIAIGTVGGFGELLILAIRINSFGYTAWRISGDNLWLVPAASVLVYVGAALLLALVSRKIRVLASGSVVLLLLSWMMFDHLLESGLVRLHWAAAAVLAAGLAIRLTGFPSIPTDRALTWFRRWSPAAAGLIPLLWLGQAGVRTFSTRAEMKRVAPATGRPNILFIVLDTVRSQSLGLYGAARNTSPTIDSLARDAMVFDRAFATAPWTLPSHASMFTGLRPDQLNLGWKDPLKDDYRTLAEVLRDAGYDTGAFVANHFFLLPSFGIDQGFSRFDYLPVSWGQLFRSSWRLRSVVFHLRGWLHMAGAVGERDAGDVSQSVLDWLDQPKDRPFFAFLNYMDAHTPYNPPAPYDALYNDAPPTVASFEERAYEAEELEILQGAYEGAVAYLDGELGKLFATLRERGHLNNTIVVLTSDHGESFGEQGPTITEHATSLYLPSLWVPLLIWTPDSGGTGHSNYTVSIQAIPATLLDMAGITDDAFVSAPRLPGFPGVTGVSRGAVFAQLIPPDGVTPGHLAEHGTMQTLADDSLQYIRRARGEEELFNHRADEWQVTNLAPDSTYRDVMAAFRSGLEDLLSPVTTMPIARRR